MNNLMTVCTLLLIGINISTGCDPNDMENCIEERINCQSASQCYKVCSRIRSCYDTASICENVVNTLEYCGATHSCNPLQFIHAVEHSCVVAGDASVPRLNVFVGFSAITVGLLTYIFKE